MNHQSEQLDLSRFPVPLAIKELDLERVVADRLVELRKLLSTIGIEFSTSDFASDTLVVLQEADAYRELLVRANVNDAVRAVMVAFAVGADLEHLAAFYGVFRAENEKDGPFRRRVLLAPEAFTTAGTHGAYVFHALSASVDVLNVDVWCPRPGSVKIAVQSKNADGYVDPTLVEQVRSHITKPNIKPLTDHVEVQPVELVDYFIEVEVFVLPGPDPSAVHSLVVESLKKFVASRYSPTRDVPISAIYAACTVGPVDRVRLIGPTQNIAIGRGQLGRCTKIAVSVRVHDG